MPRVAVVGAGHWGRNLVRNFHELGVLQTICDQDTGLLDSLAQQYSGVRLEVAYSQILNDSDVTAVAIAAPASMHGTLVREALLAGKDVFVEKPLCLSESEGRELAAIARDSNKVLMVGHLLWYHPAVEKLKSLVTSGELGKIQYIYSNRLNMGKLRREENVLWSFAPHDVSVIIGLLGDVPESVQAQGGNFLHQRVADATVTLLNFASGVRAHIFVSWLHPYKEQKLVVVGDRKMAVFDDTVPWETKLCLYPHIVGWEGSVPVARKADVEPVPLEEAEPLRRECEHFLDCVRSRTIPRTDADEGLRVLRILRACQDALERSGEIHLTENASEYFIHETAVVDPGAEIGNDTKVWHFSHILTDTRIGEQCVIGQNVMIGPSVRVGDRCKIQNNVSIYKGVSLEDGVFCGPSCVFTNVNNPRAEIEKKEEFRSTLVKRGTTIGANATIVCGHTLGEYSFIAAGAVVTTDVPAYALMAGMPARRIGWMSRAGARLDETLTCRIDGSRYRQTSSGELEAVE